MSTATTTTRAPTTSSSTRQDRQDHQALAGPQTTDPKSDTEESLPPVTPSRGRVGRRMVPVHASRLGERKGEIGENVNSSLKIKIDLDLEVEVEIYARVKGDVTIGLL
ncbi:hypothetical protein EJ05DRAFT_393349 [Pseudovirgaria hyperparasitica]|uniref:Uncharacterized protein n=1 Tax=Pseudovirgaria hyperparasitica TaxID=470096 RepID=A0A6A6W3V3_9PEZI|nr:uncharacterized protein EJ05DRAFT_393349 [Pseudovirgaria hyperparasitica]KAF2757532.1 hypothetical protein EJ05DRAFT_393349 [Pseudovirgaria hyperparasitica]